MFVCEVNKHVLPILLSFRAVICTVVREGYFVAWLQVQVVMLSFTTDKMFGFCHECE